jgi:hypothetical protein
MQQNSQVKMVDGPMNSHDALVELSMAKIRLRKIEEFIRKYEVLTDSRGFMAGKILEILESNDV